MSIRKRKTLISMRVEPEVLEWFKRKQPRGYQTLMHSVLEQHVDELKARELKNLGRAQELFRQYHTQCFWHCKPDLEITRENLGLVVKGLRKHGGHEGFRLAEELCQ